MICIQPKVGKRELNEYSTFYLLTSQVFTLFETSYITSLCIAAILHNWNLVSACEILAENLWNLNMDRKRKFHGVLPTTQCINSCYKKYVKTTAAVRIILLHYFSAEILPNWNPASDCKIFEEVVVCKNLEEGRVEQ